MDLQLKQPELFHIRNPRTSYVAFGGDQAWYPNFWHKKAGCGPTTAANQMAYLAYTRENYRQLYPFQTLDRPDYTKHMQNLFSYVTPGMMGVNHIDKLVNGVLDYAETKSVSLSPYTLAVEKNDMASRDVLSLSDFVRDALDADSPIAFLNLASGEERKLYPWHWITIIAATISDNKVIATASDEGYLKTFDLSLWYRTTPMHGGLVYFT